MPLRQHSASVGARAVAAAVLIASAGIASQTDAQPPPVSPDDFVSAVASSNQYEVMAAHVALIESKSLSVRAFAQRMAGDHTAAMATLRDTAQRLGLKPPSGAVGADQAALLAALQSLRGSDFDLAYARQQVLAHTQALATERGYAQVGLDANLRGVARADVAMIEDHLRIARSLSVQTER